MKMKDKKSFQILLSEKQYLKMIAANIVNRFGDSIDAVAFSWMVYELTGSKTWLTIIFGVNFIPTMFFQPLAGALANYLDKKKTVVLCDIGRGLAVLLIGILFVTGNLTPWILLGITFLNSTLEAMRVPCSLSIVPKILKKENYAVGVSFNQGISRISELLGTGASGVIIATLGAGGALVIDAVTFVLSGIILFFLKFKDEKITAATHHYFSELKGGFAYFKQNKAIFAICLLCFLINITSVPWDSLKVAFVSESLHLDAIALSVGGTLLTIGLVLGTFLYPLFAKRMSNRKLFIGGGVLFGTLYFVLTATGFLPDVLTKLAGYGAGNFLYGMLNSFIGVGLSIVMMSSVEESYMGRVGSIFNAVACSALPIGSFLTAVITPFFSVNQIFMVTGAVTILLFLLVNLTKGVKAIL